MKKIAQKTKPAKKPAPKPQTTALTVSRAPLPSTLPHTPVLGIALSTMPQIDPTWIGKFKLSTEQISALRKPVEDAEVEWKPAERGGNPEIPYLSHNGYRDRLDAAFGLGGWGMVPTGEPKEKDSIVYTPYALVVDGLPRAYTWGEQAYHATNKQMTYGDALEGCKSNAIVRCGKDLGIGRELWSKRYLDGLKKRVPVKMRIGYQGQATPVNGSEPAYATTGDESKTITEPQVKRLFAICKATQRDRAEVRSFLKSQYGIEANKIDDAFAKVLRKDYQKIVTAIESKEPLTKQHEPRRAMEPEVLPPITDDDIGWGLR